MPIKNAGPATITDQDIIYHSNLGFNASIKIYSNPARIKKIPPIISYFHETPRIIKRNNAGILCIKRPTAICCVVSPGTNTSSENSIRKRTNIIPKILGTHNIYLLTTLTISPFIKMIISEVRMYYFGLQNVRLKDVAPISFHTSNAFYNIRRKL